MDVSPDGRFIATGGDDKRIKVWEYFWDTDRNGTQSSTALRQTVMCHSDIVTCVSFSPDGRWLFSCGKGKVHDELLYCRLDSRYELKNLSNSKSLYVDTTDASICVLGRDADRAHEKDASPCVHSNDLGIIETQQ